MNNLINMTNSYVGFNYLDNEIKKVVKNIINKKGVKNEKRFIFKIISRQ